MKYLKTLLSPIYKKGQNICIFQNTQELRIVLFWDILRTDNVALLDKSYFKEKVYTKEQKDALSLAWLNISDEYFLIKNDDRAKKHMQKRKEEIVLLKKISLFTDNLQMLNNILVSLHGIDKVQLARMINECYDFAIKAEPRTKINKEASIEHNLKVMEKMLSSLINKYKFRYKQKRSIEKKELDNAYDMVANVEEQLGRSLPDINEMVVAQWLSYEKMAKKKMAANRNKKRKLRHGK